MPSFFDHVKSCHAICAVLLNDFLKPEENFRLSRDDFARGKRNQITLCLLSMSRNLEAFMERPYRFPVAADDAALRAAFFLTAVGETALKNASDTDVEEPAFLERHALERLWQKISSQIETRTISNDVCFENFAAYARGVDEGSREFRELILPAIIENGQRLLGGAPPTSQNGYRM